MFVGGCVYLLMKITQHRGTIEIFCELREVRSLHLLFVHLLLVLSGGILVLLVLRDEIVHVGLGLSELHLVHTFAWEKFIILMFNPQFKDLPVYQ